MQQLFVLSFYKSLWVNVNQAKSKLRLYLCFRNMKWCVVDVVVVALSLLHIYNIYISIVYRCFLLNLWKLLMLILEACTMVSFAIKCLVVVFLLPWCHILWFRVLIPMSSRCIEHEHCTHDNLTMLSGTLQNASKSHSILWPRFTRQHVDDAVNVVFATNAVCCFTCTLYVLSLVRDQLLFPHLTGDCTVAYIWFATIPGNASISLIG